MSSKKAKNKKIITHSIQPTSDNSHLNFHNKEAYRLIWMDAFSETDEWHDESTLDPENYYCHTIGFLIEDNKKERYYTIASSITADGHFCSIMNIPKSMVISMEKICL